MSLFNRVAIVGTGLIGGSIAKAIKKNHVAREVIGVSRHSKSIRLARKMGAIDKGSVSLDIIRGADLLILATPVDVIMAQAPKIARLIGKRCIVTDVGSTKEKISFSLGKAFSRYIGSHPLAGSEKHGVANSDAGIFKDTLCVLTPGRDPDASALKKLEIFWGALGARTMILKPKAHDQILAFVSHLPHIIAFSLINSIPKAHMKFASSGLKDTTRIASSDSELWTEIFLSNRRNILDKIGIFEKNVAQIKSALRRKDRRAIGSILREARRKREELK